MKIIVAPDSFKGSLTAMEAGLAIKKGILNVANESDVRVIPMADGGEGTLQCLIDATRGNLYYTTVKNPLGVPIEAPYGILGDGKTCVIEMAMSSGLYLIDENERNPLITTTYGFGELIRAALDKGCRRFILGMGGSATNDGGAGMLQALGFNLLNGEGEEIGFGGGELSNVVEIRSEHADPRLAESTFMIACDVDNPFIGPNGASHVFGPQKGATPDMVAHLDQNLSHFADMIAKGIGVSIHHIPGAGAAGGLAGAIVAFMHGSIRSGIEIVTEMTGLEKAMRDAQLVITGEGQIDDQTAHGKTPYGVAQIARKYSIPTIALVGSIGKGIDVLHHHGITAVFSIINKPLTLDEAMQSTEQLLTQAAEQVMRLYLI